MKPAGSNGFISKFGTLFHPMARVLIIIIYYYIFLIFHGPILGHTPQTQPKIKHSTGTGPVIFALTLDNVFPSTIQLISGRICENWDRHGSRAGVNLEMSSFEPWSGGDELLPLLNDKRLRSLWISLNDHHYFQKWLTSIVCYFPT